MTAQQTPTAPRRPPPVLICQGCGYVWEPLASDWTAEHRQGLADGCPECGDWLYLAEVAHLDPMSSPRRART